MAAETLNPTVLAAMRAQLDLRSRWRTPGDLAHYTDPRVIQTPALELIDRELMALPQTRRLMVFMPPQEGKSQRCSRTYPEWLLIHDPTLRIGIVSYETELAIRWGRDIKLDVETHPEWGIELRADSKAAGRWQTTKGGGIYCVGIGGALTGQPLDVLIIDDPVKDRGQAESKVLRDRNWNWWEAVGSTRLSKRAAVVLMMTRWHTDDLAGRIQEKEPGEWRTVSIPAIADSPDDPLGRPIGQELTSATKDPGHFHKTCQLRSPYVWSSLFQQHPTSAEGGLFKRAEWRYWDQVESPSGGVGLRLSHGTFDLRDCYRFITVDLASSTKTSADFTVAVAWAVTLDGDLVVLDRLRQRVNETGHFELVQSLRSRWLQQYDVVYVESRMFGTTMVYAAGRQGVPIRELQADTDKLTRAIPAADLVRQNRVWLPCAAPWLDEWLDEHADFPNTKHDDQVDNSGYAARVALAYWLPPDRGDLPRTSRGNLATPEPELDFMTAKF